VVSGCISSNSVGHNGSRPLIVIYYTLDIEGGTPLFHSGATACRCFFDRLFPPCASVLVVG